MSRRSFFRSGAFSLTFTWRTFGVSFSRHFLRPSREWWGDQRGEFWHVTALGVSVWRNTLPALTVRERGAW